MPIRKPAVAGSFYDADPINQIRESFEGRIPELSNKRYTENHSLISPHAGYMFSGRCMAKGYYEIAKRGIPENIIIMGPNHTGIGNSAFTVEDFMTPLGVVKTNVNLARELSNDTGIPINPMTHMYEHSIEVQLPFLQFVFKDMPPIVPVVIGAEDVVSIGRIMKRKIKNSLIIASSDFMHYGPRFGYMPHDYEGMDDEAFSYIEKNDVEGFLGYCSRTGITICGKYPIAIMMEIIGKRMKKLCHYNSNEIMKDENFVDYISAISKSMQE